LSSNFLGQLRTIIHMSSSPDNTSPPGSGEPCNVGQEQPPKPAARKPRRIIRPEVDSLYDRMHQHAGNALFVLPICWTDLHSKVLGVRFTEADRIDTPVPQFRPQDAPILREPTKVGRNLTNELDTLVSNQKQRASVRLLCKIRAMKFVMATLFPSHLSRPKSNADLDLYFGQRVFKKAVRVHCLWKSVEDAPRYDPLVSFGSFDSARTRQYDYMLDSEPYPTYAPNRPVVAYMNQHQMAFVRENLFRVVLGPGGTPNEPVGRLQRLRSKMLIPDNIEHDPYIVSILIAMAQGHFYRPVSRSASQASQVDKNVNLRRRLDFEDVKVQLITHTETGGHRDPAFIVYTATVKAEFLELFAHPDKAGPSAFGSQIHEDQGCLQITRTQVSVWPILGLRERLAKALGREIAGDPPSGNPDHITMWDTLIAPPRQGPYPTIRIKRTRSGRSPLSELFNSSFEEDAPSGSEDRPIMSPSAKRRRTAQSSNALEVC